MKVEKFDRVLTNVIVYRSDKRYVFFIVSPVFLENG